MADEKQDNAPVAPANAEFHLVVVHPFEQYQRGQKISDAAVIAALQAHHLSHHCRKVFPQ
jgi:hypothetical protein